jgi:hypothetical protein
MTTDLKYERIMYSAYTYLNEIIKRESMSLTVAAWQMGILLLVNKKPTPCFCFAIYTIIYYLKHTSALEANRFSANQEISRILWNPCIQYTILT